MPFHSLNQIGVLKVMKQCVYLNRQWKFNSSLTFHMYKPCGNTCTSTFEPSFACAWPDQFDCRIGQTESSGLAWACKWLSASIPINMYVNRNLFIISGKYTIKIIFVSRKAKRINFNYRFDAGLQTIAPGLLKAGRNENSRYLPSIKFTNKLHSFRIAASFIGIRWWWRSGNVFFSPFSTLAMVTTGRISISLPIRSY